MIRYLLIALVWPIFLILMVAYWFVNDRIVRHVIKREGGNYSIFWILNPRWLFEMSRLSWMGEAQEAGYGKAFVVVYAALIALFVWFLYLAFFW